MAKTRKIKATDPICFWCCVPLNVTTETGEFASDRDTGELHTCDKYYEGVLRCHRATV